MGRENGRFEIVREGWYQETGKIRTINKGNNHYEAARIFKKAN